MRLTSSGKQMGASEQPGHLGESSSGGGMMGLATRAQAAATARSVSAINSGVGMTRTRWRVVAVENQSFFTTVAALPQKEDLQNQLDLIGRPKFNAGFGFAGTAVFRIDGRGFAVANFNDIQFGDDAEALTGEGDGTGFQGVVTEVGGGGEAVALFVDNAVKVLAFDRVNAVEEFAAHMFQIEQPGAVHEFIDHPRGQVFGDVPGGRYRLREYGEGGHDVFSEAALIVGCLDHDQRGIQVGIGFTDGGDDAVSSILGWAEKHEEHLVRGVMDNGVEFGAKASHVGRIQLALEDGILNVVAGLAQRLEDLRRRLSSQMS